MIHTETISVSEAARLAGVTPRAIYDFIERKRIPVHSERVGGQRRHRISPEDLIEWLEDERAQLKRRLAFLSNSQQTIIRRYLHG